MAHSVEDILHFLEEVKDPEIPVLSLVDLGVIGNVDVDDAKVHIELMPTFVGCPAIEMMKEEISTVLKGKGFKDVNVTVSFKRAWTSDRISEKGRAAIKKYGLSPPVDLKPVADLDILEHAVCPRCDGTNTELRNPFGPTLCRSIHYCYTCQEAFEQFKPL